MFEDTETDAVQRRLRRRELLEKLDTQPWFLHHSPDPANLALDSIQARHQRLLLSLIQHAHVSIWNYYSM